MRYLLMIAGSDEVDERTAEEICDSTEAQAWVDEMEPRGMYRGGEVLRPGSDATTVRVRGDEVLLSDGPYVETKEQIGGYCLLQCADLDEAVAAAATHPVAKVGLIEVRPVWEGP